MKTTTVNLDENVVRRAKKLGINLGKFFNYQLELVTNFLERDSLENKQCRGRDLNPRSPTTRDLKSRSFGQARKPLQMDGKHV